MYIHTYTYADICIYESVRKLHIVYIQRWQYGCHGVRHAAQCHRMPFNCFTVHYKAGAAKYATSTLKPSIIVVVGVHDVAVVVVV